MYTFTLYFHFCSINCFHVHVHDLRTKILSRTNTPFLWDCAGDIIIRIIGEGCRDDTNFPSLSLFLSNIYIGLLYYLIYIHSMYFILMEMIFCFISFHMLITFLISTLLPLYKLISAMQR